MKFRSKPVEIEANQFHHGATAPIGVRTRENGSCYVVTIHGQETDIVPGDWIILENPPGDGTRAYPCKPDMFARRYENAEHVSGAALECANCGEFSTNAGQFVKDGRWVCTESCRKELALKQSYDDLAASGGIVDAP